MTRLRLLIATDVLGFAPFSGFADFIVRVGTAGS